MGVMRFQLGSPRPSSSWPEASCVYMTGMDGRVHPTQCEWEADTLSVRRQQNDSAKLHIPFPVAGFGTPVVTTTSLPERDDAWLLAFELARGKLSEIREQAFGWEQARMQIPDRFRVLTQEAFRFFAKAGTSRNDRATCHELACQSLNRSLQASAILTDSYVFQRDASRRASASASPTLLGATLLPEILGTPSEKRFFDTFNAASLPFEWRRIEAVEGQWEWEPLDRAVDACQHHRLLMRCGPLIDLGPNGLPAWLKPWENDPLNLSSFVCDFVESAVTHYQGRVRIWEVAAGSQIGGAIALSEEHRLALVARVLEAASRTDADAQFFVRVDRPWGEYQVTGQSRLSPYQLVDALFRSNLGLSGVNLEIAVGYGKRGSWYRDPLAFSRMIDSWSTLGVPLHVTLACPSQPVLSETDPDLATAWWGGPNGPSEQAQADWLEKYLPVIMAKPAVTGVFLETFRDTANPRYPLAGLLDLQGNPKLSYETVRKQRSK